MAPAILPTVFVSHGAPTLPLEQGEPAREFLTTLGGRYTGVRAVLCVSAHWNTPRPAVNLAEYPQTIHDFWGFPSDLYRITYPAPGSEDSPPGRRILSNRPASPATAIRDGGSTTGPGCPSC